MTGNAVRGMERSLFEATVGSIEQLIEGLVPSELERLDQLLDDEELVEAVVEQLAKRSPQSRTRGRAGTPAAVVLRRLVLKRLKGWSFAKTEGEVHAAPLGSGRGSGLGGTRLGAQHPTTSRPKGGGGSGARARSRPIVTSRPAISPSRTTPPSVGRPRSRSDAGASR